MLLLRRGYRRRLLGLLGRCGELPRHLFDVLAALLQILIEQVQILLGRLRERGGGGIGLGLGLGGLVGGGLLGGLRRLRGGCLLGRRGGGVGSLGSGLGGFLLGRLGGGLGPLQRRQRLLPDRGEDLLALLVEHVLVALGQAERLRRLPEGLVERGELRRRRGLAVGHEHRDPERPRLGPLPLRVADGELPDAAGSGREAEAIGGDRRLHDELRVGGANDQRQLVEELGGAERGFVSPDPEGDLVDPPVVEEVGRDGKLVERRQLDQLRLRLLDDQRRRAIDGGDDLHRRLRSAAVPLRVGKLERRPRRWGTPRRAPGLVGCHDRRLGHRQHRQPARGGAVRFLRVDPCRGDFADRFVDGALLRPHRADDQTGPIEEHPSRIDAQGHPSDRPPHQERHGRERRGEPGPHAGLRERPSHHARDAQIGRRPRRIIPPHDLDSAPFVDQLHRQPARRIARVAAHADHQRALVESLLGDHQRLELRPHLERSAIGRKRKRPQPPCGMGRAPFPGGGRHGIAGEIVFKPRELVELLHERRLEAPRQEADDAGGGRAGHGHFELDRPPHRSLDPRSVGGHPQRLVDPHVVGEADSPGYGPDRRAPQEPDGVGTRPGIPPLEPVRGVVVEAVEEREKVSLAERPHRLAPIVAVGRRDHEVDLIDTPAFDGRRELERIPFENLDLTRRAELEPGGRGNVGRRMEEPGEGRGEAVAEPGLHPQEHRRRRRRQRQAPGEGTPFDDARKREAPQPGLRLLDEPFGHPLPGRIVLPAARGGTAAVEIKDRQQSVLDAAEGPFDAQRHDVEDRPADGGKDNKQAERPEHRPPPPGKHGAPQGHREGREEIEEHAPDDPRQRQTERQEEPGSQCHADQAQPRRRHQLREPCRPGIESICFCNGHRSASCRDRPVPGLPCHECL